jgi:hypothetical protein
LNVCPFTDIVAKRQYPAEMPDPAIIRCAVPDCDWGFEIMDFSRMDQCYRAYGRHCIEIHHADAESSIHFDLVKLMLSLRK